MSELKPCPFCGGKAGIYSTITGSVPRKPKAYAYCRKCYATGESFEDKDNNGKHIQDAVDAWNRRVADMKCAARIVAKSDWRKNNE